MSAYICHILWELVFVILTFHIWCRWREHVTLRLVMIFKLFILNSVLNTFSLRLFVQVSWFNYNSWWSWFLSLLLLLPCVFFLYFHLLHEDRWLANSQVRQDLCTHYTNQSPSKGAQKCHSGSLSTWGRACFTTYHPIAGSFFLLIYFPRRPR